MTILAKNIIQGRLQAIDEKHFPYDSKIEYLQTLEGVNKTWIDTGILANNSVYAQIAASRVAIGFVQLVIGTMTGSYTNYQFTFYSNGYSVAPGATYDDMQYGLDANVVYQIDYNVDSSHACRINGNVIHSTNIYASGGNICIGRRGTQENNASTRIYSLKLYENFTDIVRDFIPVRFTNDEGKNEGAMYDKISGELFRNKGTDSFILGPDIQ